MKIKAPTMYEDYLQGISAINSLGNLPQNLLIHEIRKLYL